MRQRGLVHLSVLPAQPDYLFLVVLVDQDCPLGEEELHEPSGSLKSLTNSVFLGIILCSSVSSERENIAIAKTKMKKNAAISIDLEAVRYIPAR